MAKHIGWRLALIVMTVLIFLGLQLFTAAMSLPELVQGLFLSYTGTVSNRYDTKITPSDETFAIWGAIYMWQALHLIYSLTLCCRRREESYLYIVPGHIPALFYFAYIFNNVVNIGWLFLFDREYMEAALVFLLLIAGSLYICGGVVCRQLVQTGAMMERLKLRPDIWMTRLFVLNGVAFYGTWTTIASLVNLTIVLVYRAGVTMEICCWISLSILNAIILLWFILETFVWDRHIRYVFSPYIVLLVAFSGVLSKNYEPTLPYMQYALFLIALSGVLFLIKVLVMIIKGIKNPIIYAGFEDVKSLKAK